MASHHSRVCGRGGTIAVFRLSRTDVDLLGRMRHSIPTTTDLQDLHNFMAGLRTAIQHIFKSAILYHLMLKILVFHSLAAEIIQGLDVAGSDKMVLQQLLRCYALSSVKLKYLLKHFHKHQHVAHFCYVVWRNAMNKVVHLSRTTVRVKIFSRMDHQRKTLPSADGPET